MKSSVCRQASSGCAAAREKTSGGGKKKLVRGVFNLRTARDSRLHRNGRPMPEIDIPQVSRITGSQNAFTDKALDFQRPLS